jgi:hypothetical protein
LTNQPKKSIIKEKQKIMSKITELKNQHPELNITVMDLFTKMDNTNTNKYLPLLCKLFGNKYDFDKRFGTETFKSELIHVKERMDYLGFNYENIPNNELFIYHHFFDNFDTDDVRDFLSFRNFNEKGLISNKDVTSYKSIDELRSSVSLATLKQTEKEMKLQIHKEYEDNTWLVLRPLTFESSSKYGSATKWCTTYKRDRHYFKRYWERGILVYFINKITGLKFASFKSLDNERELSFWDSSDTRVDSLELEIDDYMYKVVMKILKSDKTNQDFCSDEIIQQVRLDCNRKKSYDNSESQPSEIEYEHDDVMEDLEEIDRPIIQLVPNLSNRIQERFHPQLVEPQPIPTT